MTEGEKRIADALRACGEVHLPDDFADRLVARLRAREDETSSAEGTPTKPVKGHLNPFARIVLLAASVTLLLGFVPIVFEARTPKGEQVAQTCDQLRSVERPSHPENKLTGWMILGFCREAFRRRVKPFLQRTRRRKDDE